MIQPTGKRDCEGANLCVRSSVSNDGNFTGIDGDVKGGGGVDKFRIKKWDKSNNGAIVYDNLLGASDSGNPTTAIAAGRIVIHK